MQDRNSLGPKHYRLEMSEGVHGPACPIEFVADGRETVLVTAERHAGGRSVTVFEDGRALTRLQHAEQGFWTIAPGSRTA